MQGHLDEVALFHEACVPAGAAQKKRVDEYRLFIEPLRHEKDRDVAKDERSIVIGRKKPEIPREIYRDLRGLDALYLIPGDEELLDPRNSVSHAVWRKRDIWLAGVRASPQRQRPETDAERHAKGGKNRRPGKLTVGVSEDQQRQAEKDQQKPNGQQPRDGRGGPVLQRLKKLRVVGAHERGFQRRR